MSFPSNWVSYGHPNPTIEIYRAILLNEYRLTIFNIIKQIQPNTSDMDAYKYFMNWLFFQYNFDQIDDPLLPTNIQYYTIHEAFKLNFINKDLYDILLKFDYKSFSFNQIEKLLLFHKNFYNMSFKITHKKKNEFVHFTYTPDMRYTKKSFLTQELQDILSLIVNSYYVTTDVKLPNVQYKSMVNTLKKHNIKNPDVIIYCILIRYLAIASLGNQLAVHPNILSNLQKTLKVNIEGFASSINHFFPNYYSLFPDLEHYFGSLGRFFQSRFIEGVYTINPPFYIVTFNLIADKILYELQNTNKTLLFLIWFPVVDKDGAKHIQKNCPEYQKRPIKIVLSNDVTQKISDIKKSKFNITTKIFCNNDISYFDYNANKSAFITYTYLFVLGVNICFNKVKNVIDNTNYVYTD
tara:strand:+ start:3545 stop:4768 length:1224 start_codon:yes stop_codon:yes gene_type:complete